MQEFNHEISDKKGSKNLVTDHLSSIISGKELESQISKYFPDEQWFVVHPDPWFADIVNYLVSSRIPEDWTKNDRDKFFHLAKFFVWDDPYLFKYYSDQVFRRCIHDHEIRSVLSLCHGQACGGHFSGKKIAAKVLQRGFYWLTLFRDTFESLQKLL